MTGRRGRRFWGEAAPPPERRSRERVPDETRETHRACPAGLRGPAADPRTKTRSSPMSTLRRIFTLALASALAIGVLTGSALAAGKPAPAGKVNINSASVEQLGDLPGVGPKLAARIVEYRQKSGEFLPLLRHFGGEGRRERG